MELVPVVSSNIAAVGYDPGSSELNVLFHSGALYGYSGVPAAVHAELMQAGSHGTYFHYYIRYAYPYWRIS